MPYRRGVEDQTPDPTETVRLLKSDFDALQMAANLGHQHYLNLCELLGLQPPPDAIPALFMQDVVLPAVARLTVTQGLVDGAAEEIREKAKRFGGKTIELPGGQRGIKVGERLKDSAFMNREERRRRG
jgi:hypothetical protein